MKILKIIGVILFIVMVTLLTVGTVESFQNNPARGCVQIDTGTAYRGYQCEDGTKVFFPPEKH